MTMMFDILHKIMKYFFIIFHLSIIFVNKKSQYFIIDIFFLK